MVISTFDKYGKLFTRKWFKEHTKSVEHTNHIASAHYDCQHVDIIWTKFKTSSGKLLICKKCYKRIDSELDQSMRDFTNALSMSTIQYQNAMLKVAKALSKINWRKK